MKRYVAGFYVSVNRDQVVLIRKETPEWQRGHYNAVGGKIEKGETPQQALYREFAEETGVGTPIHEWKPTVVLRGADYEVHFFIAYALDTQLHRVRTMTDERVDVYRIDRLPKVLPNIRWLLHLSMDPDIAFPLQISDMTFEGKGQTQAQ